MEERRSRRAYVIDLDQPPAKRWTHVVQREEVVLRRFARDLDSILRQQFGPMVANARKSLLRPLFHWKPLFTTFSQELTGIARETGKYGLSYGDLVFFNCALDFLAKCTSAVASTSQGQMHVRTLDWNMPFLKDLVIEVSFVSRGTIVCKGVTFLGCVGLLTGMRIGTNVDERYSLTYNFRKPFSGDGERVAKKTNDHHRHLWRSYWNKNVVSLHLRDIVQTTKGYDAAIEKVLGTRLPCAGYVTISGIKVSQGIVIAKGRDGFVKKMTKNYLIQTNHDEIAEEKWSRNGVDRDWAEGDPVLLSTLARKEFCEQKLNCLGLGTLHPVAVESTFDDEPVQNDSTIFTCVMFPATGALRLRIP